MNKKITGFIIVILILLSVSLLGMKEIRVDIPGENYQIPAIVTLPGEEGAGFPGVVMVHGFGSEKNEVGNFYKRLAADMAGNGIASVRFDFPGSGEHARGFEDTDINLQVRDAYTVLDWFANHEKINNKRLGLLGFSLGGVVGSTVAANDKRIKALGLWSTPGNMAMSQLELYEQYYPETLKKEYVEVDLGWRKINLSKEYFESRYSVFPLYEIAKYENPLLIIAGEEDGEQPVYARQFATNAGSYDVTLRIMRGGDHIYHVLTEDQTMAENVIDITNQWFDQKL